MWLLRYASNTLHPPGLYSRWISSIVIQHGSSIKGRAPHMTTTLNALQRALTTHHTNLNKV